jgi:hypothetical protein
MASTPPTHFDRPEIAEVLADRVASLVFDGSLVRIEFAVTRYEPTSEGEAVKGWSYTSARLVLTRQGAIDLLQNMHRLQGALLKRGLITAPVLGAPGADGEPRADPATDRA